MKTTQIINGISGSPGICIGKAYLVDPSRIAIAKKSHLNKDSISKEIDKFRNAVEQAQNEYTKIIDSLEKKFEKNLKILEIHMALFKDKMLYDKTIDTITKQKINAEWALNKVSKNIKKMFLQIDDPYFKARGNDIIQVAEKIMTSLVGTQDIKIAEIKEKVIIVAHDLSPADTSQIQSEKIKGFVTDRGGKDSHTSIIAKALDIPSVLGLGQATIKANTGDTLIVDGYEGVLIINPDNDTITKYTKRCVHFKKYRADLKKQSHLPAVTKDNVPLNLMVNIELIEEMSTAKNYGAKDVGLFRTEFLYTNLKRFPTEDELLYKYKELIKLVSPNSVTIRTFDINGDKINPHLMTTEEANPVLGLRAVRFCLKHKDMFITQLKAIFRAAVHGNIKLLIPMISCVEEIIEVKEVINQAISELEQKNQSFNKNIPLGIMIEIPSAVMVAENLADYVDFFSIGTNDLIQYSMAIDRNNRKVAHLYQALNPAILQMIKMTYDAAFKKNIDLIMCGEMAGDPVNIPILLGLGLTNFSINPSSLPVIKKTIRELDTRQARKSTQKVMRQTHNKVILKLILDEYQDIISFHKPNNKS